MDFQEYKSLVTSLAIGKQLPDAAYIHQCALGEIDEALAAVTLRIADAVKLKDDDWNVVKFFKRDFKLTLLNYPGFFDYAYPALHQSYTIDLAKFAVRKADYTSSDNPPILHRKETFVAPRHESVSLFKSITQEAETLGLFENPRSIGFKKNWERLIANKGYYLDDDGRLHPKANRDKEIHDSQTDHVEVERHRTAIDRNHLSAPMQVLSRHDYLNGEFTLLDYGCGKGDDITELEAHGIDCIGWDPVYRPDIDLQNSDVVNLGYVLNVIEEREERDQTLLRAWDYADKFLIVSVMIAGDATIERFKPYKDGVITSRNTFQKYFAQSEFKHYIETTLQDNAIAIGQGIFAVFKDKLEEQHFLLERQHIRRNWRQITERVLRVPSKEISAETIEKNQQLFTDFWETTLDLGRIPANSEFEYSEQIRRIAGSHNKAAQALIDYYSKDLYDQAKQARRDDLMVYFALGLFEKRKPYRHMPESLQRDIKAFFGSYNSATEEATELLFSVADPELIEAKATGAYDKYKVGEFNCGHSWIIHKSLLDSLPPELRIYVGCATQLYGDLDAMHLVKIHFTSGKVSLMRYDDWQSGEPLLLERIKIRMRDQDVDFFEYSERFTPSPLLNKQIFS